MLHQPIDKQRNNQNPSPCLKKNRGQRGIQKHPPSGHLAPTIQIRNGICYPRINKVNESLRRKILHQYPEKVPEWFVWLYQWSEQDPQTGLWRTRSKIVPRPKILTIKKAIAQKRGIAQILKLIES